MAHEQPEVASGSETALGVLGGCGRVVGERGDLIGWCDVVRLAGEQVKWTLDPGELDVLAADLQLAGDQLVVAEEVLDDPEIESTGDRLIWRAISLSGLIAMNPASMCSPRSTPPPAATSPR